MARTLTFLHGKTGFQVLRSLLILGRASSACGKVFSFSHQHCVRLQLDQKVCIHGLIRCKWLEHWLALIVKPVFQVLRSLLLDLGRSAFMGEKVFRSVSTTSLSAAVLGSEKSLFTVWSSTNGQYMDWHSWTNCFIRFWRTLWYTW